MKATLHAVYLLIAIMLAPTLFASLEIFGVKPNLFLIYVVFAGFYTDQKEAIWLGLLYGIIYDIIVGFNIGLNGILFMFACFLTVLFCENMIRRSNAVLSFIGVALWTVIVESINAFFSVGGGFLYNSFVICSEAVYNGLLMLILYIPLNRLFKRLYDEKR